MTNRMDRMFSQALREARKSTCNYRLGSVLVQRRKVLGRSCNAYKTHTLTNVASHARVKGLHAEIGACLSVDRSQVEGAEIYVVRILKDETFALARPCGICEEVLSRFGVSRVFYSIADREYGVLEL